MITSDAGERRSIDLQKVHVIGSWRFNAWVFGVVRCGKVPSIAVLGHSVRDVG